MSGEACAVAGRLVTDSELRRQSSHVFGGQGSPTDRKQVFKIEASTLGAVAAKQKLSIASSTPRWRQKIRVRIVRDKMLLCNQEIMNEDERENLQAIRSS